MASVLVTGTSKGIGLETALAFGRAGYQVHATMRNPSHAPLLEDTATRERLPIRVSTMNVDSDQSVAGAVAAIVRNYGPIDVLVNNAGIEAVGAVEELPLVRFRAVMETNFFGALRCIQAVLPQMRQRQSGCIVNVSSVAGRICNPPMTSYCASKWALEALSEGLAGEMKTFNVRVALVEPGIVSTSMAERIEGTPTESSYRQSARFVALYANASEEPVPPSLVAAKIVEVAASETWQLRHPVGPDAAAFLNWRKQMTDEDWIEMNAGDDATFFQRLSEANEG